MRRKIRANKIQQKNKKIGQIKKVDNIEGIIIFKDKEKIRIDDVININGEIFKVEDYE